MSKLKPRRVVERCHLLAHRRGDLGAAMTQPGAPQPGQPVENFSTFGVGEVSALRLHDHARIRLEIAIAGKRHPVRFKPCSVRAHIGGNFVGGRGVNSGEIHGGVRWSLWRVFSASMAA